MDEQNPPSTRILSRTRGAASGLLLVLLGAWGALAPFIGPALTFAFTPDKSWHWTPARGWYEVVPGAAAFLGGLLLLFARSRAITVLGAWLGILAGGWFIIGPAISSEVTLGSLGQPIGSSSGQRLAEILSFFYGLGALILYLAASAFGRLSVVTVRDLRVAERREAERREREADENDRLEQERFERERYERERADDVDPEHQDVTTVETAHDTQVFDQHARDQQVPDQQVPGRTDDAGYQSALGYREGEQPSQYSSPTYGRHDANPHGTTTSTTETQGPPPTGTDNADTTTTEQPR
jgi:hypothetical protein